MQYPDTFISNKYLRWYDRIIANRMLNPLPKGIYGEKHHVIPNSIVKNDFVVKLTAREHFICHVLLTKFTVGKDKMRMTYAVHQFTSRKGNNIGKDSQAANHDGIVTSRRYDAIKMLWCELQRERMHRRNTLNNPSKTDSARKKIRDSWVDRDMSKYKGRNNFLAQNPIYSGQLALKTFAKHGNPMHRPGVAAKVSAAKAGTIRYYNPDLSGKFKVMKGEGPEGWITCSEYRNRLRHPNT